MRSLLLSLVITLTFNSYSQLTYVPDDAFEAYLEANVSGANNGAVDNYVNTAAVNACEVFSIQGALYPVLDFTGIEAFTSVDLLIIDGVPATSIDLSALTQWDGGSPNIQYRSLTITNCFALTDVLLPAASITTINFIDNPSLTNINFPSGLTMVSSVLPGRISFGGLNSISSIDISNISVQTALAVSAVQNTSLAYLNLANGGCILYSQVDILNNPSLYCVIVDDPNYSVLSPVWTWFEELQWESSNPGNPNNPYQYVTSGNCAVGSEEISNTPKQLLKIVDLMGRETPYKPNTPLIYLYDDGSTERVFKIE